MSTTYTGKTAALMKHGFIYKRAANGTDWYCARALDEADGVSHGFSTRSGGISTGKGASLNLSWKHAETPAEVTANFRIFAEGAGLSYDDMTIVNHEHANNVVRVGFSERGRGFERESLEFCDGIITNDSRVTLVTSHADCGAYFFYDPKKRAVGMAHAGWKGTMLRIGARMAERMTAEFGTDPSDIIAATGPCICKNCFEVDAELGQRFAREFACEEVCLSGKPGKAYVDLELAAAIQFIDAGIKPENITLMNACTFENAEHFFSYRRDHEGCGSMAAFIKLV